MCHMRRRIHVSYEEEDTFAFSLTLAARHNFSNVSALER